MAKAENPGDRPRPIPYSVTSNLDDTLEAEASKFNINKSKLVRGLIRFFLNNLKNQKFIKELFKFVE